jgi:hypothetical protein
MPVNELGGFPPVYEVEDYLPFLVFLSFGRPFLAIKAVARSNFFTTSGSLL